MASRALNNVQSTIPLISVADSDRYINPPRINYSIKTLDTIAPRNNKSDVVMGNEKRTNSATHTSRPVPMVYKSRSKDLNTSTHDIGVTNRFIDRRSIQKNNYYIGSDIDVAIKDNYSIGSTPYTNQSEVNSYTSHVNTTGLRSFPGNRTHLNSSINNHQARNNKISYS
tara:strand:+ start:790 stop:1296 length:507 start_codon:yes stop_codon:yes gene_type:complete